MKKEIKNKICKCCKKRFKPLKKNQDFCGLECRRFFHNNRKKFPDEHINISYMKKNIKEKDIFKRKYRETTVMTEKVYENNICKGYIWNAYKDDKKVLTSAEIFPNIQKAIKDIRKAF